MHWQLSKKPFPSRLGINFPAAVISGNDWKRAAMFLRRAHVSLVAHWQASVCVKTQRVDKLQSGFVSASLLDRAGIRHSGNPKSKSNFGFLL